MYYIDVLDGWFAGWLACLLLICLCVGDKRKVSRSFVRLRVRLEAFCFIYYACTIIISIPCVPRISQGLESPSSIEGGLVNAHSTRYIRGRSTADACSARFGLFFSLRGLSSAAIRICTLKCLGSFLGRWRCNRAKAEGSPTFFILHFIYSFFIHYILFFRLC